MDIHVDGRVLPIRERLANAIDDAWQTLARPGTWWSGQERLAIAAEVRGAEACNLCQRRKAALSPYAVTGAHDCFGELPLDAIEAIHRLRTDAGRTTEAWVRRIVNGPLGEERYVEIVSITAIVTAVDTFDRALGRPRRNLPRPVAGAPSRKRPPGAKQDLAWIATLAPETVEPGEIDPFAVHGDKNIHRALSLVPQEVMNFFDLDVELYLRDDEIRDFDTEYRAINHAQIELIATRASSINACFY